MIFRILYIIQDMIPTNNSFQNLIVPATSWLTNKTDPTPLRCYVHGIKMSNLKRLYLFKLLNEVYWLSPLLC